MFVLFWEKNEKKEDKRRKKTNGWNEDWKGNFAFLMHSEFACCQQIVCHFALFLLETLCCMNWGKISFFFKQSRVVTFKNVLENLLLLHHHQAITVFFCFACLCLWLMQKKTQQRSKNQRVFWTQPQIRKFWAWKSSCFFGDLFFCCLYESLGFKKLWAHQHLFSKVFVLNYLYFGKNWWTIWKSLNLEIL